MKVYEVRKLLTFCLGIIGGVLKLDPFREYVAHTNLFHTARY